LHAVFCSFALEHDDLAFGTLLLKVPCAAIDVLLAFVRRRYEIVLAVAADG
jgi:hypothetical protein